LKDWGRYGRRRPAEFQGFIFTDEDLSEAVHNGLMQSAGLRTVTDKVRRRAWRRQHLAASWRWPWENWVVSSAGTYLVATFNTSHVSPNFLDSLSLTLRSVTLGIIRAAAAVVPADRVIRPDSYEAIRKDE